LCGEDRASASGVIASAKQRICRAELPGEIISVDEGIRRTVELRLVASAQGTALTEELAERALPLADDPCEGAFVEDPGEATWDHAACTTGALAVKGG